MKTHDAIDLVYRPLPVAEADLSRDARRVLAVLRAEARTLAPGRIGHDAAMSDAQCRTAIRELVVAGFAFRVRGSTSIELLEEGRAA